MNFSIKDKVFEMLKEHPKLRDDDLRLVANIWAFEIGSDIDSMSAIEFLKAFVDEKVTSPASIMRCRRKIQEEIPELRGNLYALRQRNQENVKEELGYVITPNQIKLFNDEDYVDPPSLQAQAD